MQRTETMATIQVITVEFWRYAALNYIFIVISLYNYSYTNIWLGYCSNKCMLEQMYCTETLKLHATWQMEEWRLTLT